MGPKEKRESQFDFLNRSADGKADHIRRTLESWFSRFPEQKRKFLRGEFRSDDRHHCGALLELVTHEILCAIGQDVVADPNVSGKTPDFAAKCQDETFLAECTVIQESDKDFKASQQGNASEASAGDVQGSERVGFLGTDFQLGKALEKKSKKYWNVRSPLLIIIGSQKWFAHENAVFDALLGRLAYSPGHDCAVRMVDGALGSPSEPKNCNISAVLFKPFDAWGSVRDLCLPSLPWNLVHNPWAMRPLQHEMFAFATEWVPKSGEFNKIEPSRNLNDVLGLPNPWP